MKIWDALLIFSAATIAIASPVRSSVSAQFTGRTHQEQSDYTAADYVQDGLIAMWDGIENAGYGLHDDDPTYWVDLTGGGADWRLVDPYIGRAFGAGTDFIEILSNVYWNPDRAGHCNYTWSSADEIICLETVMDITDLDITADAKQVVSFGIGSGSHTRTLWLRNNQMACRYGQYPSFTLLDGSNSISLDFGFSEALFNGSVITTATAKFSSYTYNGPILSQYGSDAIKNTAIGLKIKSLRIYGRSLTIEERLHNYNIDKARFGL